MKIGTFEFLGNKIIFRIQKRICETPEELLASEIFKAVIRRGIDELRKRNSLLLGVFNQPEVSDKEIETLLKTFEFLTKMPGKLVKNVVPGSEILLRDPELFNDFVEFLYNYWRSFDRFVLCDSTGDDLDQRVPNIQFHDRAHHAFDSQRLS